MIRFRSASPVFLQTVVLKALHCNGFSSSVHCFLSTVPVTFEWSDHSTHDAWCLQFFNACSNSAIVVLPDRGCARLLSEPGIRRLTFRECLRHVGTLCGVHKTRLGALRRSFTLVVRPTNRGVYLPALSPTLRTWALPLGGKPPCYSAPSRALRLCANAHEVAERTLLVHKKTRTARFDDEFRLLNS